MRNANFPAILFNKTRVKYLPSQCYSYIPVSSGRTVVVDICTYSTETDIVLGISSALEEYPDVQEVIAEYTLYEYIVTDYSPDAKYIVHIFENFIQPQIKNILKETNYNELHE